MSRTIPLGELRQLLERSASALDALVTVPLLEPAP
jgi:hypothetical protein